MCKLRLSEQHRGQASRTEVPPQRHLDLPVRVLRHQLLSEQLAAGSQARKHLPQFKVGSGCQVSWGLLRAADLMQLQNEKHKRKHLRM
jgi:hypothetical protein